MAFTADYCLEHPEDGGCALVLPRFERAVGESAPLALHVATGPSVDLWFVAGDCECVAEMLLNSDIAF